jgi:hypothetical protein
MERPLPSAAAVLHLRPGLEPVRGRVGRADPPLGEESAGHRPEGEELHSVLDAEGCHPVEGAPVEEREADLVRDDPEARVQGEPQMLGVEVGEPHVPDQPLLPELLEPGELVDPGGVGVAPGVVLQEVDGFRVHPVQRPLHGGAHLVAGERARLGDPLREELDVAAPVRVRPVVPRDHLGRAVVVGHVEGRQPRRDVGLHRRRGGGRVERTRLPLQVGDLPEAGQDP